MFKRILFFDCEYNKKEKVIYEIGVYQTKANPKEKIFSFRYDLEERGKKSDYGKLSSQKRCEQPFQKCQKGIREKLENAKTLVVGYDVLRDVEIFNEYLRKENVKKIDFEFMDVQPIFMEINHLENKPSLEYAFNSFDCKGKIEWHNAEEDSKATALLTVKILEKLGLKDINELYEKYPKYCDKNENFRILPKNKDKNTLDDSRLKDIKVRVDYPVSKFTSNIGPMMQNGTREGINIFYDHVTGDIYEAKHEGHFATTRFKISSDESEAAKNAVKEKYPQYYQAQHKVKVGIVSYTFFAVFENEHDKFTVTFDFSENAFKRNNLNDNEYRWSKKLSREYNMEKKVKKFYNSNTFYDMVTKTKKWEYGDKNGDIKFEEAPFYTEDDGKLYVARTFIQELDGTLENNKHNTKDYKNKLVVCDKVVSPFVKSEKTVAFEDNADLKSDRIKAYFINQNDDCFALTPCRIKAKNSQFNTIYTFNATAVKRVDDEFKSKLKKRFCIQ